MVESELMAGMDEVEDREPIGTDFAKAASLEQILNHKEEVLRAKNEVLQLVKEFRQKVDLAQRIEKRRRRRLDAEDIVVGAGLAVLAVGVSVMFHWGHALIVLGAVVVSITVAAKFIGAWKVGPSQ